MSGTEISPGYGPISWARSYTRHSYRPTETLWRRRSICEDGPQLPMTASSQSPFSEVSSDWPSKISLGPAMTSALFQQQLNSSRANDERISQSLRQRQWTEAQIYTLMYPFRPTSSSAAPGVIIIVDEPSDPHVVCNVCRIWRQRSRWHHSRGSLARSFTPSKPGHGLRAFADNASVIVVNPSGDALTVVASTLLNTKVLVWPQSKTMLSAITSSSSFVPACTMRRPSRCWRTHNPSRRSACASWPPKAWLEDALGGLPHHWGSQRVTMAVANWEYYLNHEWYINSPYWCHFKIQQSGILHMCVYMIFTSLLMLLRLLIAMVLFYL